MAGVCHSYVPYVPYVSFVTFLCPLRQFRYISYVPYVRCVGWKPRCFLSYASVLAVCELLLILASKDYHLSLSFRLKAATELLVNAVVIATA